MNMLYRFIARVMFYLLAIVTVLWTSTLTYTFISQTLPSLQVAAFLALVVFDVGMISWLWVFLHHTEGAAQRAVAIIGTLFDFVGVGLMSIAEIFLGGQWPTYFVGLRLGRRMIITLPYRMSVLALS